MANPAKFFKKTPFCSILQYFSCIYIWIYKLLSPFFLLETGMSPGGLRTNSAGTSLLSHTVRLMDSVHWTQFLNLLSGFVTLKKKNQNYLVFKFVFHHFRLLDFIFENFRSQVNRCHSLFRGFIGIPVSVLQ